MALRNASALPPTPATPAACGTAAVSAIPCAFVSFAAGTAAASAAALDSAGLLHPASPLRRPVARRWRSGSCNRATGHSNVLPLLGRFFVALHLLERIDLSGLQPFAFRRASVSTLPACRRHRASRAASARCSSSADLSAETSRAGAPTDEGGNATGLGASAAFSWDIGCPASRGPGRRIQTATTSTAVATGTSQPPVTEDPLE